MTVLTDSWAKWNNFYSKGLRNNDCLELEKIIHTEQKRLGSLPFDFDTKWLDRDEKSKPTINLPPITETIPTVEEKKPVVKMTLDDAKNLWGENDYEILHFAMKLSEAGIICATEIANIINSENKVNPARRGQSINQGFIIFRDIKENPEKYQRFKING